MALAVMALFCLISNYAYGFQYKCSFNQFKQSKNYLMGGVVVIIQSHRTHVCEPSCAPQWCK